MKKYLPVLFFLVSCNQHTSVDIKTEERNRTIVISNDTIPEIRTKVSKSPVANYSEPVQDGLNDWKFGVAAYETQKTFRFILRMQYKELNVSDTLKIPNFGIQPHVEIRKGPHPLSCVIGFLDQKGNFKEYLKAAVRNEQLRITTLNHYYVGEYRTRVR